MANFFRSKKLDKFLVYWGGEMENIYQGLMTNIIAK
jgi:hypothetical protein